MQRGRKKQQKPMLTPKKTDLVTFDFTEEELIKGLGDPAWRISNLYSIVDEWKKVIIMRPNEAQRYLLDNLHYRQIILKTRKVGFSTIIQLLMLDTALFSENEFCRVVAQDIGIAEAIFRGTFKFAYDHLPAPLKEMLPLDGDISKLAIAFQNGSRVQVSTNARGTTPTFLHVSEFGKIAANNPGKAREIITGSITAVPQNGLIFIESTAEGQEGAFYDMVQAAIRIQQSGKQLFPLDFKFFFFGWWQKAQNVAPAGSYTIPDKDTAYFDEIESIIGQKLTVEQRTWYVSFRENTYFGDQEQMWQEAPSTADEAFKVSTEGTYFREQFKRIRKEERIGFCPYDPHYPVHWFFDIGANDETAAWAIQPKRTHFGVIHYIEADGEPFSFFVKMIEELGEILGYIYLPHDAHHRKQGEDRNMTAEEMFKSVAPHWRFWLVPRTPDKQMAISQARNFLSLCVFDEAGCAKGLRHLENYRKTWNARAGRWSDTPKHGPESNAADAFLQAAQSNAAGHFSAAGGFTGSVFGTEYDDYSMPEPLLDY